MAQAPGNLLSFSQEKLLYEWTDEGEEGLNILSRFSVLQHALTSLSFSLELHDSGVQRTRQQLLASPILIQTCKDFIGTAWNQLEADAWQEIIELGAVVQGMSKSTGEGATAVCSATISLLNHILDHSPRWLALSSAPSSLLGSIAERTAAQLALEPLQQLLGAVKVLMEAWAVALAEVSEALAYIMPTAISPQQQQAQQLWLRALQLYIDAHQQLQAWASANALSRTNTRPTPSSVARSLPGPALGPKSPVALLEALAMPGAAAGGGDLQREASGPSLSRSASVGGYNSSGGMGPSQAPRYWSNPIGPMWFPPRALIAAHANLHAASAIRGVFSVSPLPVPATESLRTGAASQVTADKLQQTPPLARSLQQHGGSPQGGSFKERNQQGSGATALELLESKHGTTEANKALISACTAQLQQLLGAFCVMPAGGGRAGSAGTGSRASSPGSLPDPDPGSQPLGVRLRMDLLSTTISVMPSKRMLRLACSPMLLPLMMVEIREGRPRKLPSVKRPSSSSGASSKALTGSVSAVVEVRLTSGGGSQPERRLSGSGASEQPKRWTALSAQATSFAARAAVHLGHTMYLWQLRTRLFAAGWPTTVTLAMQATNDKTHVLLQEHVPAIVLLQPQVVPLLAHVAVAGSLEGLLQGQGSAAGSTWVPGTRSSGTLLTKPSQRQQQQSVLDVALSGRLAPSLVLEQLLVHCQASDGKLSSTGSSSSSSGNKDMAANWGMLREVTAMLKELLVQQEIWSSGRTSYSSAPAAAVAAATADAARRAGSSLAWPGIALLLQMPSRRAGGARAAGGAGSTQLVQSAQWVLQMVQGALLACQPLLGRLAVTPQLYPTAATTRDLCIAHAQAVMLFEKLHQLLELCKQMVGSLGWEWATAGYLEHDLEELYSSTGGTGGDSSAVQQQQQLHTGVGVKGGTPALSEGMRSLAASKRLAGSGFDRVQGSGVGDEREDSASLLPMLQGQRTMQQTRTVARSNATNSAADRAVAAVDETSEPAASTGMANGNGASAAAGGKKVTVGGNSPTPSAGRGTLKKLLSWGKKSMMRRVHPEAAASGGDLLGPPSRAPSANVSVKGAGMGASLPPRSHTHEGRLAVAQRPSNGRLSIVSEQQPAAGQELPQQQLPPAQQVLPQGPYLSWQQLEVLEKLRGSLLRLRGMVAALGQLLIKEFSSVAASMYKGVGFLEADKARGKGAAALAGPTGATTEVVARLLVPLRECLLLPSLHEQSRVFILAAAMDAVLNAVEEQLAQAAKRVKSSAALQAHLATQVSHDAAALKAELQHYLQPAAAAAAGTLGRSSSSSSSLRDSAAAHPGKQHATDMGPTSAASAGTGQEGSGGRDVAEEAGAGVLMQQTVSALLRRIQGLDELCRVSPGSNKLGSLRRSASDLGR